MTECSMAVVLVVDVSKAGSTKKRDDAVQDTMQTWKQKMHTWKQVLAALFWSQNLGGGKTTKISAPRTFEESYIQASSIQR